MNMFMRILAFIGLAAAIGLSYILSTSTPAEAGAVGVLSVFLLFYIMSVVVLTFLLFWFYKLVRRVFYSDRTGQAAGELSARRAYYFSSVLALMPVMFMGLRSVGKLDALTVSLVVVLMLLGCLYVSRQTS